jgi:hypothetical protein
MGVAGLGILLQLASIALNVLGVGLGAMQGRQEMFGPMLQGGMGVAFSFLAIIGGVVVILGAMRMKSLTSYGFAMAGAIIAMIPCLSPCCCLGLPVGIWALVVLMNQDVKAAFQG